MTSALRPVTLTGTTTDVIPLREATRAWFAISLQALTVHFD